MEWLSDLLSTGASVASGGIFGLLGSAVGAWTKAKMEDKRQAWEQKKWAYEADMLKLQMQARTEETEHELAIVSQAGSWKGLEASYGAANTGATHMWVNDIKSLFRPFLTLSLWVLAYLLVTDESLLLQSEDELIKYMVYSTFFAASTATMWWFGDRALAPPDFKNR